LETRIGTRRNFLAPTNLEPAAALEIGEPFLTIFGIFTIFDALLHIEVVLDRKNIAPRMSIL
jgi:hypothetical protein